jgi:hypothetical protein
VSTVEKGREQTRILKVRKTFRFLIFLNALKMSCEALGQMVSNFVRLVQVGLVGVKLSQVETNGIKEDQVCSLVGRVLFFFDGI